MSHICVLGAGAWGTALAKLLADQKEPVRVWSFEKEVVEQINGAHENQRFLPGISLPENLVAYEEPEACVKGADMVVIVVPSHAMRVTMQRLAPVMPKGVPLVTASKGIENDSLMLMHEIIEAELGAEFGPQITCLSGPSFAKEVAQRHPTAVVVAGTEAKVVEAVQHRFSDGMFRAYTSSDVVGVEMGGALKNVIAIAAGVADGLGFGYNTRAGMITRGLNEIARLASKKGAQPLTLSGLAGMGDLVLTCTGSLSRNRTVGVQLGKGKTLSQILAELGHVAEGVKTTKSAYTLAKKLGVEMPLTSAVYDVLYTDKPPKQAVAELNARQLRPELDVKILGKLQ